MTLTTDVAAPAPTKTDEIVGEIRKDLAQIELDVLTNTTLADLIRRGAPHTVQPVGWGSAEQGEACAWSAAGLAAEAQGLI
jgi:hypothetical protein